MFTIWTRKKKGAFLNKQVRKMTEYILYYTSSNNTHANFGEKAYSDKIISIWDKGDVANLSQEMYNRINTHFTYQQVKVNVSHIYAAIFTDQK